MRRRRVCRVKRVWWWVYRVHARCQWRAAGSAAHLLAAVGPLEVRRGRSNGLQRRHARTVGSNNDMRDALILRVRYQRIRRCECALRDRSLCVSRTRR